MRDLRAPRGSLRQDVVLVTAAGMMFSFWFMTISGAVMTQFARSLHTPDWAFGVIAALPFLGLLAQLPAAYILDRYGFRKSMFIITGTIGRLAWVLIAAIPWLLPGQQELWWPLMIAGLLCSWAMNAAAAPPIVSWLADLIPSSMRGRYFSLRNMMFQPVGVFAALLAGFVLDHAEQQATAEPSLMLTVTSITLAVAGLVGTMDILLYVVIKDRNAPRGDASTKLFSNLLRPLRQSNFRNFAAFNFTFVFGIAMIGQYVWLYVFDVVGWTNQMANLLIMAVPVVAKMFVYRAWGRWIDRLGKKPVLLIGITATACAPLAWLLVTSESMWLGYLIILLVNMAWPGFEIANFNMLLDLTAKREDEKSDQKTTSGGGGVVALNSVISGIGGILAGTLAAMIARNLDGSPMLETLGLTYHSVIFIASSGVMFTSLLFAIRLHEPKAATTVMAVRVITDSVYSNVRQAALLPSRAIGLGSRLTYRINADLKRQVNKQIVRAATINEKYAHNQATAAAIRSTTRVSSNARRLQRIRDRANAHAELLIQRARDKAAGQGPAAQRAADKQIAQARQQAAERIAAAEAAAQRTEDKAKQLRNRATEKAARATERKLRMQDRAKRNDEN